MINGIVDEADFMLWNKKIEEEIEILYIELNRMKESKKDYINVNERIQKIKERVTEEIYELAIVKSLIERIERIVVLKDGDLSVSFYEYL